MKKKYFVLNILIGVLSLCFFTACVGQNGIPSTALDSSVGGISRSALKQAKPVKAKHAMVVSAQHLATNVGINILKEGGNAIDAAVATAYALAVTHPCCGNIGGGGFMILHLKNGKNLFLNFREKAPLKAAKTMFQDKNGKVVKGASTKTYLGVGVPGTVMGLNSALKKYGTMSLAKVLNPAIKLAKDGFVLEQGDINILNKRIKRFKKYPNVASIFLKNSKPYKVGDILKQPLLAHSLELIKKGGTKAFYKGQIAKKIVQASKEHGGILSMKDFAKYSISWSKPITCTYHSYKFVSDPPPSSGGVTICEILNILKKYPIKKYGYSSVKATHYLVEAERRAFADRNTYLGDPKFIKNPITRLLSKKIYLLYKQV